MPPSTHYLNLLNLNQPEDLLHQEEYTDADISKQLELFTNSNFLDTETFAYQPFDLSTFDAQVHSGPQGHQGDASQEHRRHVSTAPRNQRPQFQVPIQTQPEVGNNAYIHQYDQDYSQSPTSTKRTAEDADLYGATPASSEAGDNKTGRSLDEEDKRRRNTAASARFRIKKKQREQALQESAKVMMDKNSALESRVKELELENKWLRSLLKPVNSEQSRNVLASI